MKTSGVALRRGCSINHGSISPHSEIPRFPILMHDSALTSATLSLSHCMIALIRKLFHSCYSHLGQRAQSLFMSRYGCRIIAGHSWWVQLTGETYWQSRVQKRKPQNTNRMVQRGIHLISLWDGNPTIDCRFWRCSKISGMLCSTFYPRASSRQIQDGLPIFSTIKDTVAKPCSPCKQQQQ